MSTKNLTAEQQREILVTAGLVKETGTLTMAQATEALTTDTRNAADVEALMLKAGLISELGAETTATITVDAAKLKELVDTKVLTQAEAELLAMKAGVTLQSTKEAATLIANNAKLGNSFAIMGKTAGAALKGIGKGLLSFASAHPILAIGATIIGSVAFFNSELKKLEEEQEELISNAKALQEEYRNFAKDTSGKINSLTSQADEFNELSEGVDKYGNNISLASDEYDRYKSIVAEILGYSPELIQGYDAEGNAIADKNGLLERSIELLKEEQRLKLKEMTTDEKTGEAYDAAEAGWQRVQGYEGANTRNEIARWFENNATSNGWNYEVDIAKILGIKDEWKSEGNDLGNAIIGNIETVTKNIKDKKAELLALEDEKGVALFTTDEIDNMIDLSNDWQYAYNQWQQDIEDAKHGMDDQFDLYAQRAKSYNDLTDAQKVFVNEYIRATGDITDAEGHLLSEDKILEKAKGYEKFVNEFAELNKLGEGGSVDLTFRPEIDTEELNKKGWEAGEGFATVFSSAISNTDFEDLMPTSTEDTVAINFTPIIVDPNTGEFKGVLSEEELYAYAHDVLAGVREDDLNLQIGAKFEGKNAIDEAVADGERIHYLHEKLFINNDTVDSWEELRKVLVKTGDDAVQAGENANKMTVSLDNLKSASDSISSLQAAFKEVSEDGYITTETLSKIKEAVGDNISNWNEYQQKLLTAKAGSAEFNQVLSDLTYAILENKFSAEELANATEAEVAAILRENGVLNANEVAHDMVTRAKIEAKGEALAFAIANGQATESLYGELEALGLTKTAITDLADAYRVSQEAMTQITQGQVLARLNMQEDELAGIKTLADAYAKIVPDESLEGDAAYMSQYGKDAAKLLAYAQAQEKIQSIIDEVSTRTTPTYTTGKTSSTSKSTSSSTDTDKDKPDKADPTDAIINRIGSNVEALERQGEIIDNQLDMVDVEKEYDKYVELTNKALDNRLKTIEASKTAQKELSKEAQKIRDKYKGIDIDSFFDVDGDFTEAYNKYYDSFTSKVKQEAFEDDMKMIQAFKKEWYEYYEDIMSLEKEVFDLRKDLQETHYDHLSSLLDELERHANLQQKQADNDKDYYDYLISKTQALLDIKRAQFDLENKLISAQREAETALATSKIGSEYLDEETRNLVYNDDDYELEIGKIEEISQYVEGLTEDYISDINALGEDEIYKAEEITAQYERRLALKEKELEIVQAEVDLQKKQDTFNNVLAERNIRQIVDGKWVWTHDTDKLRQATEDLSDAEARVKQLKREQTQLEYTNSLENQIGQWKLEQEAIDAAMEHLQDKIDEFSTKIELLKDPLEDFGTIVSELTAELGSINIGYYSGSSSSGSSGSSSNSGRLGSVDPNANVASVVQQMMNNSTKWHVSDSSTKEKLHAENQKLASSIGADYNAPDGKYYQNGKPLYDSGGVLKGLGGIKATEEDEIILPPDITSKILSPEKNVLFDKFTNNLETLFNPDLIPIQQIPFKVPTPDTSLLNNVTNKSSTVNYNMNGDINITEANDIDEFMRKLLIQVQKPRMH